MFVLFKVKENLPFFVSYINAQHANIKFTSELDNSNNLSFLTLIYQEKIMVFTLLFIENPLLVVFSPILSFIDEKYKESLILALLHQCYEICSKNALIHTEIDNLRNIFQNNGYPVLFMDK